MSFHGFDHGYLKTSLKRFNDAFDLARRLGDQQALMYCYNRSVNVTEIPSCTELRTRITQEFLDFRKSEPMQNRDADSYFYISSTFLVLGDRKHAEELWADVQAAASRANDVISNNISLTVDAIKATLDGHTGNG